MFRYSSTASRLLHDQLLFSLTSRDASCEAFSMGPALILGGELISVDFVSAKDWYMRSDQCWCEDPCRSLQGICVHIV